MVRRTSFCGAKYSVMLHVEAGYEAEGIPNVVVSIFEVDVADLMDAGISGRWTWRKPVNGHNTRKTRKCTNTPIPNENPRHIHLQRPHSAAGLCKRLAVAIRLGFRDDAALAQRTIALDQLPSLALRRVCCRRSTSEGGMKRYLVVRH